MVYSPDLWVQKITLGNLVVLISALPQRAEEGMDIQRD